MARSADLSRRFFRLAPVRIVVGFAFLFLAVVLRDVLLGLVRTVVPIQDPPAVWLGLGGPAPATWAGALYSLLAAVLTVGVGYGAYRLFTRLLEKRTPAELARARAVRSSPPEPRSASAWSPSWSSPCGSPAPTG